MLRFILILFITTFIHAENNLKYDTSYCSDPEQHETWGRLLNGNEHSHHIQALHALWIGLCIKVEGKQITTNLSNEIFEMMRENVIAIEHTENDRQRRLDYNDSF